MTLGKSIAFVRLTLGRAVIHAGLRLLPPGRVRSELYDLFDRWATDVAAQLHRPSSDAMRWANEVADEIEASLPAYLTPDEEAAFRRRLFGTSTNPDGEEAS